MTRASAIDWERLGRLARRRLGRPAGPLGGAALRAETGLAKRDVDALARGGRMPALGYLRACAFLGVDPVTLAPLGAMGQEAGSGEAATGTGISSPRGGIPPLGDEILWDFFGLAVMGARLARGQTVEQAARAARVSTATLSRASHGRKVDAQALLRLAAWLGRHPHELTAPAGTSAAPAEPVGGFGRAEAIEELRRAGAIAGRMQAAAEAGSNEINALQCRFPVKHCDVSHGGEAEPGHDTAAEYALAIAAIREMKVRAGEVAPNPERPAEARWAAEGPVPVRDLETGRAAT